MWGAAPNETSMRPRLSKKRRTAQRFGNYFGAPAGHWCTLLSLPATAMYLSPNEKATEVGSAG